MKIFLSILLSFFLLPCVAQKRCSMSPLVKQLVLECEGCDAQSRAKGMGEITADNRMICCMMRLESVEDAESIAQQLDGTCNAVMDDICIMTLPVVRLSQASLTKGVRGIEARMSNMQILLDKSSGIVNIGGAHEGFSPLPQPFTGKGVVLGSMDIGFDLTHPTFLNAADNTLRIKALWDQLDLQNTDNSGKESHASHAGNNGLPIGKEHTGEAHLKIYAHTADSKEQYHGTHTLGIAAGNGWGTSYKGMLPDADICLVSNITGNNIAMLPDSMKYLATNALDLLGFKYLFDYADKVGKPCVITFSEGGSQGLYQNDLMFYELLDKLTGPGHIIVASAGNESLDKGFMHKTSDMPSARSGIKRWGSDHAAQFMILDISAPADFDIIAYDVNEGSNRNDTITISLKSLFMKDENGDEIEEEDSLKRTWKGVEYNIISCGYTNAFDNSRSSYEILISSNKSIGYDFDIDVVVRDTGNDADVKVYCCSGIFTSNGHGQGCDASVYANVQSPGSAPSVICVGSTAYRSKWVNYKGVTMSNDQGSNGIRSTFSSVGPTMDNRIKPDVMAPGSNIISSINSYYEENTSSSGLANDVKRFVYNGRTYSWYCTGGTSMSCPMAAGIIGLWLEACPTLTPDDVRDIIAHTSHHYDESLPYPNNEYGYGEIDAYAGLLHVLKLDNIEGISRRPALKTKVTTDHENSVTVHLDTPSAQPLPCSIYSVGGKKIYDFTIPAGVTMHTTPLYAPKGYYILQIGTLGSAIVKINYS